MSTAATRMVSTAPVNDEVRRQYRVQEHYGVWPLANAMHYFTIIYYLYNDFNSHNIPEVENVFRTSLHLYSVVNIIIIILQHTRVIIVCLELQIVKFLQSSSNCTITIKSIN